LQLKIPETVLYIPDDNLIQFKEALIFGFLGVLRLREEVNVLASVTGATKDHSSGVIFGA
jgi:anhydro-N-acetylmuramic acid kinase